MGKANRDKVLKQYQQDVHIFNLAQEDCSGAEVFFRGRFDQAETTYERVMVKYYLGKTYMLEGDKQRAQIALEFVISRGNKLHVVDKAREMMQCLNEV